MRQQSLGVGDENDLHRHELFARLTRLQYRKAMVILLTYITFGCPKVERRWTNVFSKSQ